MENRNIIIILFFLLINFDIASCQAKVSIDTCINKKELYLYLTVDELPSFEDKNLKLMGFIYKNLKWPNEFDGQGTVIVSFVVKKNGDICNIKIEKGLCSECDNEVIRVFNLMPKWKPGKINNKPVNVILYLPILFRLE